MIVILRRVFMNIRSAVEKNRKVLFAALLLLQAVISVLIFIAYNGVVVTPDTHEYTGPAQTFLETGRFLDHDGNPMLFRTPGYPFFLAAVYMLGGTDTAVSVIQLLLSLSASLLIFAVLRMITRAAWPGIIAVLFYTFDYIHYYHSVTVGADILFAYLLLLSAFFLAKWMTGGRRWSWFLPAAVSLQLAGLTKPTLMYYLVILAALLFVLTILKKISWKALVAYLLLFVLCFVGWCARNYHNSGYFILSSIRYVQFYGYDAPGLMAKVEGISTEEAKEKLAQMLEDKYGDTSGLSEMAQNECRRDIGSAYVMSHPGAYLIMNVRGLFLLMLGPGRSPLGEVITNDIALKLVFVFNSGILLLLYLIYAAAFLSRLKKVTWFEWLLFFTTCYLMAATASMGYQRYRIAFYPLVLLGAMLAVARVTALPDEAPLENA